MTNEKAKVNKSIDSSKGSASEYRIPQRTLKHTIKMTEKPNATKWIEYESF